LTLRCEQHGDLIESLRVTLCNPLAARAFQSRRASPRYAQYPERNRCPNNPAEETAFRNRERNPFIGAAGVESREVGYAVEGGGAVSSGCLLDVRNR
jgi:hypothetical protein